MTRREKTVNCLHLKQKIVQDCIWHLQMHPEGSKWTEDNVAPKFWARGAVLLSPTMNSELHLMNKALEYVVEGFFSQLSEKG